MAWFSAAKAATGNSKHLAPEDGTLVPSSEALIMTVDGGKDLALRMPDDPTPLAMLLMACFFRYSSGDEVWTKGMVDWAEKTISDKALPK